MKALKSLNDLLSANARQKTTKEAPGRHNKSLSQPKYMPVRFKDMAQSFLFIIPSLIGVVLFFGAPFGVVIFYSLVNNPTRCEFVGLSNFSRVLHNSAFLMAARHTMVFSAIAVPLAVVLSLLLAIVLEN